MIPSRVFQKHHCPFYRAPSIFNPFFKPIGALNLLLQKASGLYEMCIIVASFLLYV